MSQFVGSPRLFRAVNLSHKKDFVPVSTLRKRFTHPQFALSFVIIPGVIHEGDAPIDCLLDQANRLRWRQCWLANVRPPSPIADTRSRSVQAVDKAFRPEARQDPLFGAT